MVRPYTEEEEQEQEQEQQEGIANLLLLLMNFLPTLLHCSLLPEN